MKNANEEKGIIHFGCNQGTNRPERLQGVTGVKQQANISNT
jgi:hypothetical protein